MLLRRWKERNYANTPLLSLPSLMFVIIRFNVSQLWRDAISSLNLMPGHNSKVALFQITYYIKHLINRQNGKYMIPEITHELHLFLKLWIIMWSNKKMKWRVLQLSEKYNVLLNTSSLNHSTPRELCCLVQRKKKVI